MCEPSNMKSCKPRFLCRICYDMCYINGAN